MNDEYYILEPDLTEGRSFPSLDWAEDSFTYRTKKPIETSQPIELTLGYPIPEIPTFGDILFLPRPVFSERLSALLRHHLPFNTQLIPVTISEENNVHQGYHLFHIHNKIDCIDDDISDIDRLSSGEIYGIGSIKLDSKKLNDIPLEKRLAFTIKESIHFNFYHKTLIDLIFGIDPKPTGARLFTCSEWTEIAAYSQKR